MNDYTLMCEGCNGSVYLTSYVVQYENSFIKIDKFQEYEVDFNDLVLLGYDKWNGKIWVNVGLLSGYIDKHLIFKVNGEIVHCLIHGIKEEQVVNLLMNKELLGI